MRLRYTGRAKAELETAFVWYEKQQQGLGHKFLDCVEEVIDSILQMPRLYALQYENLRRALVRRFPFSVFYTIEQNEIIIHAVFDNRQNPVRLP